MFVPGGDDGPVGQTRADLVILSADAEDPYAENDVSGQVRFVFEVKRRLSSEASVTQDLIRLHRFLKLGVADARAFLIYASEGELPSRFAEAGGVAKRNEFVIDGTPGPFRVRRVLKAASSLKTPDSAHHVCIVEDLLGQG